MRMVRQTKNRSLIVFLQEKTLSNRMCKHNTHLPIRRIGTLICVLSLSLSPRCKSPPLVLVVLVASGAGVGEERPDEVHGHGGEGSAAEAKEEVGDDDEDVLGTVYSD